MELFEWTKIIALIVFGILVINIMRLCLDLQINKKTDLANRELNAQRLIWNQINARLADWVTGLEEKAPDLKGERFEGVPCGRTDCSAWDAKFRQSCMLVALPINRDWRGLPAQSTCAKYEPIRVVEFCQKEE